MTRICAVVRAIACLAAAAALTNCGVSNSGTTPPQPSSLTFNVSIAAPPSAGERTRHSLPASTQSVTFAATGVAAITLDTSAQSAHCTAAANNTRACTVVTHLKAGTYVFAVTAYDGPNGTGNVLASTSIPVTVAAHSASTIDVSVGGTPVSAQLAYLGNVSDLVLTPGTPATRTFTLLAQDAAGNTILGGAYTSPVTIQNSDTSGAVTVAPSSVSQPGSAITVTYNGASLEAPVTLTPVVAGQAQAGVTMTAPGSGLRNPTPIPSGEGAPQLLSPGISASNALWFASPSTIGYVNVVTGSLTSFPLPVAAGSSVSTIFSLFPTADGTMWFTQDSIAPEYIGSITPAGTAQTLLPGVSASALWAAARSNDVWFTYGFHLNQGGDGAPSLGLFHSGAFSFFPVADDLFGPVAFGADGDLYAYDMTKHAIAAFDVSGAAPQLLATYGSVSSFPNALFAGPDGRCWMVEGGALYHLSSGASPAFVQIPNVSVTGAVAVTADKTLWALTPDGLLRVANASGGVDAQFTYTHWPTPLKQLSAAPDGTLWGATGSQLGRVALGNDIEGP